MDGRIGVGSRVAPVDMRALRGWVCAVVDEDTLGVLWDTGDREDLPRWYLITCSTKVCRSRKGPAVGRVRAERRPLQSERWTNRANPSQKGGYRSGKAPISSGRGINW